MDDLVAPSFDSVPVLLTSEEAARALGLGQRSVLELLRKKRLKGVKIGRAWRVSASEIGRVAEQGLPLESKSEATK